MEMLTFLNDQHKSIKFEMELPDMENFLPILDVRIGRRRISEKKALYQTS